MTHTLVAEVAVGFVQTLEDDTVGMPLFLTVTFFLVSALGTTFVWAFSAVRERERVLDGVGSRIDAAVESAFGPHAERIGGLERRMDKLEDTVRDHGDTIMRNTGRLDAWEGKDQR